MKTIIVNGEAIDFDGLDISHTQVCQLAREPFYASVTYQGPRRIGRPRREGMTHPGSRTVQIEDGMEFFCIVTGNA